jgi:hypothetical protein
LGETNFKLDWARSQATITACVLTLSSKSNNRSSMAAGQLISIQKMRCVNYIQKTAKSGDMPHKTYELIAHNLLRTSCDSAPEGLAM